MKNPKYNFWCAVIYEIVNAFAQHYKSLRTNKIVKLLLNYCKHDWVLWKVESTLRDLEVQTEKIKKQWEAQEPPKFSIIEHEPDGSKAQELLGGAIEIKSNFKRD
ncbi:MAG: hypothetical protein FJ184_05850 [Gammaproteobacteria bacterium]|nr:hypothetical protein [Gammaproteobacteria bacterium]